MTINKNWVFYRLNEPEKKINVDLPYDAMLREPRDISHLGGDKVSFFKGDNYGYEKIINIEKKDHVFYLEFEGVYHHPIIYVNGEQVYEREYGYIGFVTSNTKNLFDREQTIEEPGRVYSKVA